MVLRERERERAQVNWLSNIPEMGTPLLDYVLGYAHGVHIIATYILYKDTHSDSSYVTSTMAPRKKIHTLCTIVM